MQNKTKSILKGSLLAGSLISLGALQANAEEIVRVENLGSGSEVRAALLASERVLDHALELSCGEKKEAKAETTTSTTEGKAEEQKCGEGKCGEGKCGEHEHEKAETTTKTESKTEQSSESKAEEHKCGEGKCGM